MHQCGLHGVIEPSDFDNFRKREVNKVVLKVPAIEQKVIVDLCHILAIPIINFFTSVYFILFY